MLTRSKAALLVLALAVIGTQDAYAYIDPGSGSLLLQMLIASIIGGLFYLRGLTTKVRDFFRRLLAPRDRRSTD